MDTPVKAATAVVERDVLVDRFNAIDLLILNLVGPALLKTLFCEWTLIHCLLVLINRDFGFLWFVLNSAFGFSLGVNCSSPSLSLDTGARNVLIRWDFKFKFKFKFLWSTMLYKNNLKWLTWWCFGRNMYVTLQSRKCY